MKKVFRRRADRKPGIQEVMTDTMSRYETVAWHLRAGLRPIQAVSLPFLPVFF